MVRRIAATPKWRRMVAMIGTFSTSTFGHRQQNPFRYADPTDCCCQSVRGARGLAVAGPGLDGAGSLVAHPPAGRVAFDGEPDPGDTEATRPESKRHRQITVVVR